MQNLAIRITILSCTALLALTGCKKKEPLAAKTEPTAEPTKTEPTKAEPPKPEEPKKAATVGCSLPGSVTADVTLATGCNLTVTENVTVTEGAVVTIQPGVKLSFNTDTYLWINHGRLVAKGTKESPITFTSANKSAAAGDWVGIGFEGQTLTNSLLDWVVIEHAGRKSHGGEGAITVRGDNLGKRISITNCTFRKLEQAGVHNAGEGNHFAKLEGNTFEGVPIALHLRAEILGSVGANKLGAPVEVVGGVSSTQTWPVLDSPVHVMERLQIGGEKSAAILTLADKTTLKFAMDTYLEIGTDQGGGLVAKEATFTSVNATPADGDWVGLFLNEKVTGTVLEGCTVSYAGRDSHGGRGAVTFNGAKLGGGVKIANTTFKHNKRGAIGGPDDDCGDLAKPASGNKSEGVPLCSPKE
jgi:hypothetical protein